MISRKGEIIQFDVEKILTGLGIGLAGAVLTYFQEAIPTIDFGELSPLVVVINSTLVNYLRKLLSETRY